MPNEINTTSLLRKLWMSVIIGGARRLGRHPSPGAIYIVPDPWAMDSEKERFRFEQTNEFILGRLERPASILEIGCGEGHQSAYLRPLCDSLVGVDPSSRAIERAKARVMDARFFVGDVFSAPGAQNGSYDLVLACEVLYYMNDIQTAVKRMDHLARFCLATCYEAQYEKVAHAFLAVYPRATQETFTFQDTRWHLFWSPSTNS